MMVGNAPTKLSEVVRELMQQRLPVPTLPVESALPTVESTDGKDQRYAEMMERFQIRKIVRSPSASSNISGKATMRDATEYPALTAASTSVNCARLTHADNATVIEFAQWEATDQSTSTTRAARSSRFSVYWSWIAWKRKLGRCVEAVAQPISPASTLSRVRIAALTVALAVHVVVFPFKTAFYAPSDHALTHVEAGLEMVFLVDCVLMFKTAYFNKHNQLVTSRRRIIAKYVRSWFALDLLSSLPADTVLMFAGRHSAQSDSSVLAFDVALQSQRIVRLARTARVVVTVLRDSPERRLFEWLMYSRFSHLLRIAWIILCIVLIAHYLACGWRLLAAPSEPSRGKPLEEYVACFYDVLQLLQGQGVPTTSVVQNVYATFAILMGSLLLAIVFGNVGILVSNFNANSTSYQRKMESVFAVMSKLQLPAPLRERIHQYYEHLWREYESLDGEIVAFSKDLSHTLELEVVLYKYMDLITHVPFWHDTSPDFQKQLMLSLQVRVYLPDDYIIRRGEVGDEFFMINRGVCVLELGPDSFECTTDPLKEHNESLLSEADSAAPVPVKTSCYQPPAGQGGDLADIWATTDCGDRVSPLEPTSQDDKYTQPLRRGQSFGEIALIMNYERTANARASTYVEMCVLNRSDFQKILIKHPKDRKEVLTALLTKTMENNEATQVWCPLRATAQSVFGREEAIGDNGDQISAVHAALLISNAVNLPLDDDTIRFGIGVRLHEQLVELRYKQQRAESLDAVPPSQEVPSREPTSDTTDTSPKATVVPSLVEQVQEMRANQTQLTSLVIELLGEVRSLRDANDQLRTALTSYETKPREASASPGATAKGSNPKLLQHRLSRRSSARALGGMSIPEDPPRVLLPRERASSMSKFTVGANQNGMGTTTTTGHAKPRIDRRVSFSSCHTPGETMSVVASERPDTRTLLASLVPRAPASRRVLPALERLSPTMYADQLFERRSQEGGPRQ